MISSSEILFYLDILLNSRLPFNRHLEEKIAKAKSAPPARISSVEFSQLDADGGAELKRLQKN